MAAITPRLILREAAATEFEIGLGLDHIAISIDKISGPGKANRTALGVDEDCGIVAHELIEVIAQRL